MNRDQILARTPGPEMDALYARFVLKKPDIAVPKYSADPVYLVDLLYQEGVPGNWLGVGLCLLPLNNGKWACGRASHAYYLEIMQDHYQDKELVIANTANEAACKMRLILELSPGEAVNPPNAGEPRNFTCPNCFTSNPEVELNETSVTLRRIHFRGTVDYLQSITQYGECTHCKEPVNLEYSLSDISKG